MSGRWRSRPLFWRGADGVIAEAPSDGTRSSRKLSLAGSRVLVTGAAGFIGFHCAMALCALQAEVVGVDCLNDYYDVALKQARLAQLSTQAGFHFEPLDLGEEAAVAMLFKTAKPDYVLHLAAQAGVRHSLSHPFDYARSNLTGFLSVLEGCRHAEVKHLAFASSSSVYGANAARPYSEHQAATHPVSLYAATKGANELMAHSYAHLFRLPVTGLRFFTVYGPWGRPDMAYYSFTRAIIAGRPIEVFNHGAMSRDFTYIDDAVEGVIRVLAQPAEPAAAWDAAAPDPATSNAPFRLYNIGNSHPVTLQRFIAAIEQATDRKAETIMREMQPGDVLSTAADTDDLEAATGFSPSTSIEDGIARFVDWYRTYHGAGLP